MRLGFVNYNYFIVLLLLLAVARKTYAQAPKITSFTPTAGPMGTKATINGINFSGVLDSNVVYFGAARATVNTATTSQLFVTVPPGASFQPVSVINKTINLSANSTLAFRATFSPGISNVDARVRFVPGNGAADVRLADVDGDGKPDIIATNPVSHTLMIFRNKSTAGKIDTSSFAAPVVYKTGQQPGIAGIADMDGDGKLDIVLMNVGYSTTANGNNSLSVFHNLSTPGKINLAGVVMVDSTKITPASNNFQLKTGDNVARISDINSDGKPDIVVSNTAGFMTIYRNTYTADLPLKKIFGPGGTVPVGIYPTSFAIGDMDNDGKPDIVTTNYNSSSLTILRNISALDTISAASFQRVDLPLDFQPLVVSLADIDGDGILDAMIGRADGKSTVLMHNTSTPGHLNMTNLNLPGLNILSNYSNDLGIQDVNGDGKPDLLTYNSSFSGVYLYTNKATIGQITTAYFNGQQNCPVSKIPDCIGDLDGDGIPDFIVGSCFGIDIYHSKTTATQAQLLSNAINPQGDMMIYPNPTTAGTKVKYFLPLQSDVQIQVYNESGQLVKTYKANSMAAGDHENAIETANLKLGVYVVTITATNYSKAGKLMVQ